MNYLKMFLFLRCAPFQNITSYAFSINDTLLIHYYSKHWVKILYALPHYDLSAIAPIFQIRKLKLR